MTREDLLEKVGISEEYLLRKIKYRAFSISEWDKYKSNWVYIQKLLSSAWICPECGKIYLNKQKFSEHLKKHKEWNYIRYVTELVYDGVVPKCKICGSDCEWDYGNKRYYKTCSNPECKSKIKAITATNNIKTSFLLYGHPFSTKLTDEQKQRLNLSESDYEQWRLERIKKQSERGKLGYLRMIQNNSDKLSDWRRSTALSMISRYGSPWSLKLSEYQIKNLCELYGFTGSDDPKFIELMKSRRMLHSNLGKSSMKSFNKSGLSLHSSTTENLMYKLLLVIDPHTIRGQRDVNNECRIIGPSGYPIFPDFYLPKFSMYIESDGRYKARNPDGSYLRNPDGSLRLKDYYIRRHDYIVEATNKHVLHLWDYESWYYSHNLKELESRIIQELRKSKRLYSDQKFEIVPFNEELITPYSLKFNDYRKAI